MAGGCLRSLASLYVLEAVYCSQNEKIKNGGMRWIQQKTHNEGLAFDFSV